MYTQCSKHSSSSNHKSNIIGWCLTSGGTGHEAQCIGLFEALNIDPIIKRVNPQGWYKNLAPIGPAQPNLAIAPPWPDLLIVSGRQSLPYARYVRRHSKGKTFVVVLQKPGLPSSWFDFIWVPQHDQLKGANVFSTLTPPNRISNEQIASATLAYQYFTEKLPKPIVTVLIGGASRSFEFGIKEVKKLTTDLITLQKKTGCSFLVSPSYRTGKEHIDLLIKNLSSVPAYIWNMSGDNPLIGFMGLADYFIVTADSMNMLGEAAFTGKPILIYPIPCKHPKFTYSYKKLADSGIVRWFSGDLENWTYEPLDATAMIATELWSRFMLHRNKVGIESGETR